jgi:lipoate synthase
VHRYLPPAGFGELEQRARALGFPTVYSGVFVRSSFNAEEVYRSGGRR